jgi:hypothetical protein
MTTMSPAKAGTPKAAARGRTSTAVAAEPAADDTAVISAGTRSETIEITPAVGFAWIVQGIQPYLGYIFVGLGLLALFLGWYGASGTPIVAKQVPYLASDGVLAVVLIAVGNRIFLINDIRRDSGRLDRLEEMVAELHAVLLARSDALPDAATATSTRSTGKPFRAVARGTSYHRPDCTMVASKDTEGVSNGDVISRGLRPCRLCEPPAVKK